MASGPTKRGTEGTDTETKSIRPIANHTIIQGLGRQTVSEETERVEGRLARDKKRGREEGSGGTEPNNPRNGESERKDRLEREKGRASATYQALEASAENVRARMRGRGAASRRPTKHSTHQGGAIDRPVVETPHGVADDGSGEGGPPNREAVRRREGIKEKGGTVTWSPTPDRGKRRNESRLEEADRNDADLIGESSTTGVLGSDGCAHVEEAGGQREDPTRNDRRELDKGNQGPPRSFLENRPELFFLPPLMGPDDRFTPPAWFFREITNISSTDTKTPSKPPVRFETSADALEANAKVLENVGYDLSRLIEENVGSTLDYGSEFRTVGELETLLGQHPNFDTLATTLKYGMSYVFNRELDELTKSEELQTLVKRGNHKSAQDNPEQVGILLGKDVLHGFVIPIPVKIIPLIPNAAVQPLGLVQQWTAKEDGTRAIKYRITQDLSFSSNKEGPPRSINSRIDMGSYPEMIYGWCFPRILHYVASMRTHHPRSRILISKYDYSDAYRRIAHSALAASQTIAVNGETAFISLRLTFGGSPNPPTWCMFSEIVTDLANEISLCQEWDPRVLRSPAQPRTPTPVRLPDEVPLGLARTMTILVPPTRGGKVDGFIDDLINVFLDTPENCARQPHVVPLAMHVTSRPHAGDDDEPLPRRPILSAPKLTAEGSPAEVQVVLGWRIDTRRLEVSLPEDKFIAWTNDIRAARTNPTTARKELEQLLGRLNHASYVIPLARHFLSRIRESITPTGGGTVKVEPTTKGGRRSVSLSREARSDLKLWEVLLRKTKVGVSINLLTTRQPDRICWSDACPLGIGGYNLRGRAWRIKVPPDSPIKGQNGVNNLLEFMGMVVNVWITCMEPDSRHACILAIGDNTSAIGWLHHTAHLDPGGPTSNAQLKVARKLARVLLKYDCCLASQHLKGELNVVADLLSFDGEERGKRHPLAFDHPPNDVLTERFRKYLPTQVTEDFAISQLPDEISSWITQVLRIVERSLTDSRRAATKASTACGEGGRVTVNTSGIMGTPTSINYPSTREDCSSRLFSDSIGQPCGGSTGNLKEIVRDQWSQTLCAKPLATWLRRFGAVSGRVPARRGDNAHVTSHPTTTQGRRQHGPTQGPAKGNYPKTPPSYVRQSK